MVKNPKNDRAQIPTRPIDTYISHLINTFPRLRNVLECVPEKMGLNVEIKYPASIQNSYLRDLPVFEVSLYYKFSVLIEALDEFVFGCHT